MTMSQIKDIITEKHKMDKSNEEVEQKIQGRGISDQEQKQKQFEAEREQIKKISNSLKFQKENANSLMERLKDEETKAKDMLDEKIRLQNSLNQLNEDLGEGKAISTHNREEIIKLQIRLSQLQAQEEKMVVDHDKLEVENQFYIKKNQEYELENAKLNQEIQETIQKIDINYLLKQIDSEDLRILAQNNKMMNSALHNLMGKWELIQKAEEKKL